MYVQVQANARAIVCSSADAIPVNPKLFSEPSFFRLPNDSWSPVQSALCHAPLAHQERQNRAVRTPVSRGRCAPRSPNSEIRFCCFIITFTVSTPPTHDLAL